MTMSYEDDVSHYEILGLAASATQEDIRQAYRQACRVHHPDKNPQSKEESTAFFQRLQVAYSTLSDGKCTG